MHTEHVYMMALLLVDSNSYTMPGNLECYQYFDSFACLAESKRDSAITHTHIKGRNCTFPGTFSPQTAAHPSCLLSQSAHAFLICSHSVTVCTFVWFFFFFSGLSCCCAIFFSLICEASLFQRLQMLVWIVLVDLPQSC